MKPTAMTQVIGRKRYNTETATLLASDAYWDGHNFERGGRNSFLFRTPKDRYFLQIRTCWQGEHDHLRPVSQEEAIELWEGPLREHEVEFEEAFPGVEIEEA